MDPALTLTPAQADALREVAMIGAGRAATALAVLAGHRAQVSVPAVHLRPLAELSAVDGAPTDPVAALRVPVRGDLSGTFLLLAAPAVADALGARVVQQWLGGERRAPLLDSALCELGGMLAGAYLAAVGEFLGKVLGHLPPTLVRGARADTLRAAGPALGRPGAPVPCLAHDVRLEMDPAPVALQVRWLLDPPSLHALLRATGVR